MRWGTYSLPTEFAIIRALLATDDRGEKTHIVVAKSNARVAAFRCQSRGCDRVVRLRQDCRRGVWKHIKEAESGGDSAAIQPFAISKKKN